MNISFLSAKLRLTITKFRVLTLKENVFIIKTIKEELKYIKVYLLNQKGFFPARRRYFYLLVLQNKGLQLVQCWVLTLKKYKEI